MATDLDPSEVVIDAAIEYVGEWTNHARAARETEVRGAV
jgi:hypothetical protein